MTVDYLNYIITVFINICKQTMMMSLKFMTLYLNLIFRLNIDIILRI